jgi:hypothetical protein
VKVYQVGYIIVAQNYISYKIFETYASENLNYILRLQWALVMIKQGSLAVKVTL